MKNLDLITSNILAELKIEAESNKIPAMFIDELKTLKIPVRKLPNRPTVYLMQRPITSAFLRRFTKDKKWKVQGISKKLQYYVWGDEKTTNIAINLEKTPNIFIIYTVKNLKQNVSRVFYLDSHSKKALRDVKGVTLMGTRMVRARGFKKAIEEEALFITSEGRGWIVENESQIYVLTKRAKGGGTIIRAFLKPRVKKVQSTIYV